jgi:hypothetical protein
MAAGTMVGHSLPERPLALPTVSLCMIVKNEAAGIRQAIESATLLCFEIIVLDTGSDDDTAAIAKECGADVYHADWNDDFAETRNAALFIATGDWVLTLDGDEVLDLAPERVTKLREFLRDHPRAIISTPVESDMGNSVTIQHVTPRLFPRLDTVSYHGIIHETPIDSTGTLVSMVLSDLRITHGGYTPHAIKTKGKSERNTRLIQKAVGADPHNPQLRMYWGTQYQQDGFIPQAVEQYRQTLYLCRLHPNASGVREQAIANLVTCLGRIELFEQAQVELRTVLRDGPIRHPGFWVAKGNNENQLGLYNEAIASFHIALANHENHGAQQIDTGVVTWMPWYGIGYACSQAGRSVEAEAALLKALTFECGPYVDRIQASLDEVRKAGQ